MVNINIISSPFPKVSILGVPVASLHVSELHEYIKELINQKGKRALILHVNVYAFNLAFRQPWLAHFFQKSDLVFADGAGVLLAARILGHSIPERITYADWMWKLAAFAEANQFSMYFLGARPGVAQKASDKLLSRFPNLRIVGVHDGYFEKSFGSPDNQEVIQSINAASPDILIIGFGMPLQEKWLSENWQNLNAQIALTGGAVFDYISGELHRAPRWMTDHGLEWLGRLIIEPGRLWRRYLIGNPLFICRVLMQRLGVLRR